MKGFTSSLAEGERSHAYQLHFLSLGEPFLLHSGHDALGERQPCSHIRPCRARVQHYQNQIVFCLFQHFYNEEELLG